MKKKTAKKSQATGKKEASKGKKKAVKNELNPEQVLKDISALVEANANGLAEAVIGEGMKGQVSPVKYLFEMAHIYPKADASTPTDREESLAETLLDRLKIPKTPVVHDELRKDDEDMVVIQPVKQADEGSAKSEEEAETVAAQ